MKVSIGPGTYISPAPVWIVGTYDDAGKANVMTASWAGICCSDPPCVSVSLRAATYTYGCINSRKAFTLSLPSEEQMIVADYFGVASGKTVDKLGKAEMHAVASQLVDAPYIEELPLVLECALKQTVNLGLHTMFVGQVMDVKVEKNVLDSNNMPIFGQIKPFIFDPFSRSYFACSAEPLGKAFSVGRKV